MGRQQEHKSDGALEQRRDRQLAWVLAAIALMGLLIAIAVLALNWPSRCAKSDDMLFCPVSTTVSLAPDDPRSQFTAWLEAVHGDVATAKAATAHDSTALTTSLEMASGEVRWLASYLVLLLASFAAFSVALYNAYRLRPYTAWFITRKIMVAQFAICCLFPIIIFAYHETNGTLPYGMGLFGVLSEHLLRLEPTLKGLIAFSDGISVALLFAWAYFLIFLYGARSDGQEIRFFMAAQNCVNSLSGALGVVLIAVVVHARAYLTWPLGSDGTCGATGIGATTSAYCGLVDSLLFMYGAISTIICGMMIGSVTIIITRRLNRVAQDICPDNPAKWIADRSLGISTSGAAVRLISAAAPLFAGILGGAINKLTG